MIIDFSRIDSLRLQQEVGRRVTAVGHGPSPSSPARVRAPGRLGVPKLSPPSSPPRLPRSAPPRTRARMSLVALVTLLILIEPVRLELEVCHAHATYDALRRASSGHIFTGAIGVRDAWI